MPDEQTPNETPETPAETPAEQTPTTDTPASQEPAEETEGKPADQVKDLPDWAQKIITDLRGENANYRTRAKTAEEQLSSAKTPEEMEAAVNEVRAVNARLERELLVSRVAAEFDLPGELAEVLKGDDVDALKAHAKTLAKFAGSPEPGNLSGGLTPTDENGDEADPVKVAMAVRKRRY